MNSQIHILFNESLQSFEQGKMEAAEKNLHTILRLHAKHFDALHLLGIINGVQGRPQESIKLFRKALTIDRNHNFLQFNLAKALSEIGKDEEALPHHKMAVQLSPQHAEAWLNYGVSLTNVARFEEAIRSYEKALTLHAHFPAAWSNYGTTLFKMGKYGDALSAYDKALALDPQQVESWINSATIFVQKKMFVAAIAALDNAITIRPTHAEAWLLKASVQMQMQLYPDAQSSIEQALVLQPDSAQAWLDMGLNLSKQQRHVDAQFAYAQASKFDPSIDLVSGYYLQSKLAQCDWRDLGLVVEQLLADIKECKLVSAPFISLAVLDDPDVEKNYALSFNKKYFPDRRIAYQWPVPAAKAQIKVGYFSADFYNHATAYLVAELFEKHDRACFEIVIFSFGPLSNDMMYKRVEKSADQFIDVSSKSDQEIAELSRSMGIDIAVDLKGYTNEARTGIFAFGAAPIQINYLGYPGTLGAPYIDYIVGDSMLIPKEATQYYSEKIIRMPHSYQINDRQRAISDTHFTRAQLGLPEKGFVFACFNNNYKYAEESFGIWMNLLRKIPGSVLWLLQDNTQASDNLRLEAQRHGIAADRLVFAPRMELADHLARHRQADLFLDTFDYNAHTTASDALWVGLPLITRVGKTFSSRVAASLLSAVGLPELITRTSAEYESTALRLATDSELRSSHRERLLINRMTSPLFNSGLFVRHLEQAFSRIHERRIAGSAPEHIDVIELCE